MKASNCHVIFLLVLIALVLCSSTQSQAAWSTNPSENTPVCAISENQDDPQIISDGAGGSIIAWRHVRPLSGPETDIYVQRLDAEGNELWNANGTSVCRATGNQIAPALVGDGSGGAIITWLDYRSGSTEIYAQRVDSSGDKLWGTDGVPVCTSGTLWEPEITSDGAGGAIITWLDSRSGSEWDVYAQRVDSSGSMQWTVDGVAVCAATGNQRDPRLVTDDAGGAIITWYDSRSGVDDDIYAQRVDGSGSTLWAANGEAVCLQTGNQQYPQLVGDDNGGVIICWQDERFGDADIYLQRLDGNGTPLWTADGLAVCTAASDQDNIALEQDGTGGVFAAWEDQRGGTEDDIYAQRMDGNGTALWAADGIAVCTATNDQYEPNLTGDGYGGLILVWEDFRSGSNYDLYTQRIDQWGFLLWDTDGVVVCTATNHQLDPVLTADGSGGAYIAWDDDRSGSSYDIYAQHVDGNGRRAGAAWSHDPTENNPVCLAENWQGLPQLVNDGSGGAIVAWWDYRFDDFISDIFAQRFDTSGSALWIDDGVPICLASNNQQGIGMISDGQGGAIMTWYDYRNGSGNSDIYAQRVDASGITLWALDGVAVCSASNYQKDPAIVSDGSGGAIISWIDQRSGIDYDIYAQRIDALGNVLWSTNGIPVCTESGTQTENRMVEDGSGGAIITWKDYRFTPQVVFAAQRVDSTGAPVWISGGVVVNPGLESAFDAELVSDDNGGAIVTWMEFVYSETVIKARRFDDSGDSLWISIVTDGSTGEHNYPVICGDGAGGAIIGWHDSRSSSGRALYAQRVTSTGHTDWIDNGVEICPTLETGGEFQVVGDGSGGSIFTWEDSRSGSDEIFCQRLNGSGNAEWNPGGAAVSTATGIQKASQLLVTESDCATIVWHDTRNGENDIFAQQIDRQGFLGHPSPAISSVIDHSDDQGGVVVLSWGASGYDQFPQQVITHYSVWMHQPDRNGLSVTTDQSITSLDDLERAGWVEVDDVTATYQEEYGYHTPTYEDYTGGTPFPLTEYKVIAHTSDPWVFWESGVRSGCSVDNLAPGAPLTLLGLPDEADVLLTWEASGHHDEDLAHYNVYRGTTPGFTVDEHSLIGTITDIEYTDPNPGYGTWYYRVAGEDVHGNVGDPSNEAAVPVSTSTVTASLSCSPPAGVLPFVTGFNVQLINQYQGQVRRIAGRIHVTLANGTSYGNWRAGFTNIAAGSTYVTSWNQPIPALAPLVGDNLFRLVVADVTPAPYNQPPYPPAGDTDSDTEIVTGIAP